MTNFEWPSREEWAERRRTAYFTHDRPHRYTASNDLSLYACPEEVEGAIAALKKLWSDYGKQLKAEGDISPWLRQRRTGINMVIKALINGCVRETLGLGHIPLEILRSIPEYDMIIKRYEAAVQTGDDKYIAECAAEPVDDAAWANELEQRAKIERWRANRCGQAFSPPAVVSG